MDEHGVWKIVYFGTIFSLIILALAYFLISPKETDFFNEQKTEIIAEFTNTRVSGRKEGKKVWEFQAKAGWTDKDKDTNTLTDVSNGTTYSDGLPVVRQLQAPRVKVYRSGGVIDASGFAADTDKGKSRLTAWIDLKKASTQKKDQSEWTRLRADRLQYWLDQKRSEISGNVSLTRKNSTIYAQKVVIDHEKRIADATDKITVIRQDGVMSTDSMRYFGQEEKIDATGNVKLDLKHAKRQTKILANQATLYSDMDREMTFSGSLEVIQGKKAAVSDSGTYSRPANRLTMSQNVKAVFEKASAIIQSESIRKLKEKETKEMLKEKTFLTSDNFMIFTNTGNAQANGNVVVYQQKREARADQAVYDEKKETLVLTGNVSLKKVKDWVNAQQVIVSIKNKTFEASGEVKAEFKL